MKAFLDYLNENSSKEMQIIKCYMEDTTLNIGNPMVFVNSDSWSSRLLLFNPRTQKAISERCSGLGAYIASNFDFYPDILLRFT